MIYRTSNIPMAKNVLLLPLYISILLLVVGIVVPIVAQTQMAALAYEIREINIELSKLEAENQTSIVKMRELQSTANLEERAKELGMIPSSGNGIIRLSTGEIIGPGEVTGR